jgi:PhnB protein
MKINPYLNFNGNCGEAFQFYAKVLGGKDLHIMTFADAPPSMPVPPELKNNVMHARFTVGSDIIMGSDAPGDRYNKPQDYAVSVHTDTPEDAERIFASLSEDGTVGMAMAETFFAKRWGMTTDRFGTHWMVICEKPM